MQGQITQLSISDGGVPKTAISRATVTEEGLEGDRQSNLKYHGGPDRAVCLWSQEIIDQLQADGHPIAAGCAGENITLQGLDWGAIAPGTQLRLGDEVVLEITDYATPCRKNMRWFSDRKFGRMSQKQCPGQSRLYARVMSPGVLQPGDRADVLWRSPL
ncbi:MAG: MOSC domain-containing protein [Leptolyngbyaceae bacterium]|nr:MOSC domain-containing protein [Leptolyngbyaceae bacterium]